MKKLLFIAVLTSMVSLAFAQDTQLMSKKGTPILPEAGDWSIGIDAVPFIDWVFDKTRIMSSNTVIVTDTSNHVSVTNTPTSAAGAIRAQRPLTLVGLYMKDANTAYRGRVGINFNSHSTDYIIHVNDDSTDAANHEAVDVIKTSHMGIMLGAGIQM